MYYLTEIHIYSTNEKISYIKNKVKYTFHDNINISINYEEIFMFITNQ